MQENKICPYPGLRPFTEEESIFFKGRDKHIEEIIHQLEEKKFVMLTGASGDGKSSIVYAGVIPNARAGFFKAKYNNWIICSFRPERSPLENIANSIADNLQLDNKKTEKELGYGFSALIDLYKFSPYFINEKSEEWQNADDKTKKQIRRKGANLFILIDQFEEFFTNPENYNNGKASLEAQTVVNLLLETAKIALLEDIPIYIVCTMRSDYIGQCAAFRSLPEYIGFSQFFVPRLKRKEIYEVIEQPALLSGNSISKRLIEVLVNDLREGFDQLPVLQHALNQVWKKADSGNEEMDLLHLAKVCGMPAAYLPQHEKEKFSEWYNELMQTPYAEILKTDFEHPSLENVLNAHSNELYEKSHEYYNSTNSQGQKLTVEKIKFIIKKVFQCLTKIDDGRAVRNRMTLQEIADIINDPEIAISEINYVINIFREQGNTLIYPFISEQYSANNQQRTTETQSTQRTTENNKENKEKLSVQLRDLSASVVNNRKLSPATVLDITHESLIRNWEILKEWSAEENENYQNYLDFEKKLDRWLSNEKESGFLLPVGPYTFFEKWVKDCKPNKFWLVKYDDSEAGYTEKLEKAEETLNNTKEFLKLSARKLTFSRFVLKYGANSIAAAIGIVFLIFAITYYTIDFRKKQNGYVITEILEKGKKMLKSKQISLDAKAHFIINAERLKEGNLQTILDGLHNDTLAFDIAFEVFVPQNISFSSCEICYNSSDTAFLMYLDYSLSKIIKVKKYDPQTNILTLDRINRLLYCYTSFWLNGLNDVKVMPKRYKWVFILKDIIKKWSNKLKTDENWVLQQQIQNNIAIFNTSIELFLTMYDYDSDIKEINLILENISPFEKLKSEDVFSKIYPKNKMWKVSFGNKFTHNGGYQILSYMYATSGDIEKTSRCLDSILKYNSGYYNFENENFYRIINYLTKNGNLSTNETDNLLMKKYEKHFNIPHLKIVETITKESGLTGIDLNMLLNVKKYPNVYHTANIIPYYIIDRNLEVWNYYLEAINNNSKSENDFNFQHAMYWKNRGVYEGIIFKNNSNEENASFKKAIKYLSYLPNDFLTEGRLDMLLFSTEKSGNSMSSSYRFNNNMDIIFINALIRSPLYQKLYKANEVIKEYLNYVYNDFNFKQNIFSKDNLEILITNNPIAANIINKTFLNLYDFIPQIKNKKFREFRFSSGAEQDSSNKKNVIILKELNNLKIFTPEFQIAPEPMGKVHIKLLKHLAEVLAEKGYTELSLKVIGALLKPEDRKNALTEIVINLQEKGPVEDSFIYLDSLFSNIEKDSKFELNVIRAMAMIGSQSMYDQCIKMMKEVKDEDKPRAYVDFIRGVAFNGFFYKAYKYIPDYVSAENEMDLFNEILHAAVIETFKNNNGDSRKMKQWKNIDKEKYGMEFHL